MSAHDSKAPIAIIGMGCRFSGDVTNPDKLWDLVAAGGTGWTEIPTSRFKVDGLYHPNSEKTGTTHVRGGHFLKQNLGAFDASFFNISGDVASTLDPAIRLELEVVYEALESAGIPIDKVAGSNSSVFAGTFLRDYHDTISRDPDMMPRYAITSTSATMASNRISHFYDLRGPSMSIDTGCSTTLTALHVACENLRSGGSSMSIVTGATLLSNPDAFISMSNLGFLSPDGRSYAFDSRANGYGRGEGVAAIILKPLSEAIRDGDAIRSVVRETALNHGGKTPTITSPSQAAQEELIRSCYRNAGLSMSQTTFVEAHGTGTPKGDPLEVGAIAATIGLNRGPQHPLYLGSVKTTLGHTEATSGLASIIKASLALEKGLIPPNTLFDKPNEKLNLKERNIKVPTSVELWPSEDLARRVSVNNFGFGGANAHAILEHSGGNFPIATQTRPSGGEPNGINGISKCVKINGVNRTNGANGVNGHIDQEKDRRRVFVVSAKDEQACRLMALNLREYASTSAPVDEETFLDRLSHTLGSRRSKFAWNIAYIADSLSDMRNTLKEERISPVRSLALPRIGFVFTGQGAQWYAMGRELLVAYPVFKSAIVEYDGYIKEMGSTWTFMEELQRDEKSSKVNDVVYSLPMATAIQLALVELLRSWDISPTAISSHSSGEVAAAYAVGAISARSAIGVTYLRGFLVATASGKRRSRGGMMAVGLGREEASSYLSSVKSGKVVVACINSPSSVTVSGDNDGILELEKVLHAEKIFARRLKVSEAFHSDHMLPLAELFHSGLMVLLKSGKQSGPVIFSSPKTGGRVSDLQTLARPSHWVESMLLPVEFENAFRNMCFDKGTANNGLLNHDVDIIIEVGPHGALGGPIQQIMTSPDFEGKEMSYLTCLVRGKNAVHTMQQLVVDLIHKGYRPDLDAVNFPHGRNHEVRVIPNLPQYPWNHQTNYWLEPRMNRAYKQRKNTPHDLLGSPLLSVNSNTPTWRNIIRISDIPWIRDHMIQSNIVYPGAGFIAMAIEGIKQIYLNDERVVTSYELRDVDFAKALLIPDTNEGIEVQMLFRSCDAKVIELAGWTEFQVSSVTQDNTWTEHCKGLIKAEINPIGEKSECDVEFKGHFPGVLNSSVYTRKIDPRDIWKSLKSVGIYHGPAFQHLDSIQSNRDGSLTTLSIGDTRALMPKNYQREHVIHPTTLDSIIQSVYSVLPRIGETSGPAFIPRSIKAMRISARIVSDPGHQLKVFSKLDHLDSLVFRSNISVLNDSNDSISALVLEISGLSCQSVGVATSQQPNSIQDGLCSSWKWLPDVSFLNSQHITKSLKFTVGSYDTEGLAKATMHYMQDGVASFPKSDVVYLPWHLRKFYGWMESQLKSMSENRLGPGSSHWMDVPMKDKDTLLREICKESVSGEVLTYIGSRIPEILRQKTSVPESLIQSELFDRYRHESSSVQRSRKQVVEIVRLCTHKMPQAKILEIDAGTGSCTKAILNALKEEHRESGLDISRYDFTDASSALVDEAQKQFDEWKDDIVFKTLDMKHDPAEQGFECGMYDVVIACQVLHDSKDALNKLQRIQKLLRPGGKLIMTTKTQHQLNNAFILGSSSDYWLNEDEDDLTPSLLSTSALNQLLTECGFTGLDFELRDCEHEDSYELTTMISTAVTPALPSPPEISIVFGANHPPPAWLEQVKVSIQCATGVLPTVEQLEGACSSGKVCVYLSDLQEPSLVNMESSHFSKIKHIATRCEGLLWVARGGVLECENPYQALHLGFLRTLRSEYAQKAYVSLDVDPTRDPWSPETADAIVRTLKVFGGSHGPRDLEYAERNGVIMVPRAYRHEALNKATSDDSTLPPESSLEPLLQPSRQLRLIVQKPGLIDTLCFEDDPKAALVLPPDFIEIEPKAFGLNFRDVMVAMGQLECNTMGYECSGIISRLGEVAAAQGFQVGDRICALLPGDWSTRPRTHWTSAVPIPGTLSFDEAASVPLVFATAFVALYDTAQLRKGESVLIHAATGGVGQAAITLAKLIGAEIFVTVGTKAKQDFVMGKFGIPADHIFSSRDPSFRNDVLNMTGGKGVDVVLNSLAGLLLQESFSCLTEFGRFVEIGKRDLEQNSQLSMQPFTRNLSFSSIDLLTWEHRRRDEVSRVLKSLANMFEKQTIAPIGPITVFPMSAIERAFRTMQAGQHMGKIVITVNSEDKVPVLPAKPIPRLSSDSSYLIVGGLGGIGRSLCEWMMNRGARHLIVLSRSGISGSGSGQFLTELEAGGCEVRALACDVANKELLAKALQSCSDMPPIRGVIQAAMLLRDSTIEKMNVDDFNAAVRPKMEGSWNLHSLLNGLEFFIMLSSLIGVMGGPGQANYAAGGTYQDGLASYRRAKGLPAVSIDLGMVKNVGIVANTAGVSDRLERLGFGSVGEQDLVRILDYIIVADPPPQILTGINTKPGPHWDNATWIREPRFSSLKHRQEVESNSPHSLASQSGLRGQLASLVQAGTAADAESLVLDAIIKKLAGMFGLNVEDVTPSRPLEFFGVDSLVAVELRNWINAQAGADLSIFELLQSPSLTDLAADLVKACSS